MFVAMMIKRFVFILLCGVCLHACSDSAVLNPIPSDGAILAFGDSLTVGVGVSKEYSYPAVLQHLSERRVVSAGGSGEETQQGLGRLPDELDQVQPDLVVLLQGGNDILRNRNLQKSKQNLASMIELIQSKDIDVLLVGVPAKKLFSDVAPLYKQLADEYKLVFVEDVLSGLLRNNEFKSDAVHLNEQGYRILAESIHETLVKNGAL